MASRLSIFLSIVFIAIQFGIPEAKLVGLDRNGDIDCDDPGDMQFADEGYDSLNLFFADVPESWSWGCVFCAIDSFRINTSSVAFDYYTPEGWNNSPIRKAREEEIDPHLLQTYPDLICWLVQATDFELTTPMPAGEAGRFLFEGIASGCDGFLVDSSATGMLTTDWQEIFFHDVGDVCAPAECPPDTFDSKFVGLDRDGDLLCDEGQDMQVEYGIAGTFDTTTLFFDGVPSVDAWECVFCVENMTRIDSSTVSFEYDLPEGWEGDPIRHADLATEVSGMWTTTYPELGCWLVRAEDTTGTSPFEFTSLGRFHYSIAEDGCVGFIIDGPKSSFSMGVGIYKFDDPLEMCLGPICGGADYPSASASSCSLRIVKDSGCLTTDLVWALDGCSNCSARSDTLYLSVTTRNRAGLPLPYITVILELGGTGDSHYPDGLFSVCGDPSRSSTTDGNGNADFAIFGGGCGKIDLHWAVTTPTEFGPIIIGSGSDTLCVKSADINGSGGVNFLDTFLYIPMLRAGTGYCGDLVDCTLENRVNFLDTCYYLPFLGKGAECNGLFRLAPGELGTCP